MVSRMSKVDYRNKVFPQHQRFCIHTFQSTDWKKNRYQLNE